jgi:hypothetical protein
MTMAHRVLPDYPRRAHLDFYRRNPNPFYSVSFGLEATKVLLRARALRASTYGDYNNGFFGEQMDGQRAAIEQRQSPYQPGTGELRRLPAPGRG